MGYSTDFDGKLELNKKLSDEQFEYLIKFADTRRMKRHVNVVKDMPDPARKAVGLPIGDEGEYYVGGEEDNDSVAEINYSPGEQPGLWCQWIPVHDEDDKVSYIEWDGGEKFYEYVEWLKYIIKHFLKPWGYVANGVIIWQGESMSDRGKITVKNNKVTTKSLE